MQDLLSLHTAERQVLRCRSHVDEARKQQRLGVLAESGQSTVEAQGTRSQSSGTLVAHIGKDSQDSRMQLACTGRLRGSATQVQASSPGQSTRGDGTRSQSSGSRGDTLARACRIAAAASLHRAAVGQRRL